MMISSTVSKHHCCRKFGDFCNKTYWNRLLSLSLLQPLRRYGQTKVCNSTSNLTDHHHHHVMTKKTLHLANEILLSDDDNDNDYDYDDYENSTLVSNHKISNRMRRRLALSQAITLMESRTSHHRQQAELLLERIREMSVSSKQHHRPSSSFRIGIAGPPGAGKSTLIEKFGTFLLNPNNNHSKATNKPPKEEAIVQNHQCQDASINSSSSLDNNQNVNTKNELGITSIADEDGSNDPFISYKPNKLAVLCIDPSSSVNGGSILGDKTRMMELSCNDKAFVRPSPSGGVLGGLTSHTDDVITLCTACGYDLVFVESVGVGQSEIEITKCVDMVLLMVPPGGGDELQGVKKGIIEIANLLVVNKADGNLLLAARSTASDYQGAMQFWNPRRSSCTNNTKEEWGTPPVLLVSAKTGDGMSQLWDSICKYRHIMTSNGQLHRNREKQRNYWMWKYVKDIIIEETIQSENTKLHNKANKMIAALENDFISPRSAAREIIKTMMDNNDRNEINGDKNNDS